MKRLLVLMTLFAATGLAADVSGNWKATAEGPNGTMERTFTFRVDGNKLTGETTSSMFGKSTITDGKIDGENLSFTITVKFQDNEMKLNYKGKVSGNEIKFTVENPDGGRVIEWLAKKVQ
jgi:P pilus assembly chaperone PapD